MGISIIGAGNVGMALGRALVGRGEVVTFGVTNHEKYRDAVAALGRDASLVGVDAAIAANDIVILAVPYDALPALAQRVADWHGKILVDATNPLAPGLNGLALGTTTSGAEELAKLAKGARVVKAFNTTGAENLGNSAYAGGKAFMPVCGDDADARRRVLALAERLGFDAIDFGALNAARYLEPFAMAWIHLAFKQGFGRSFAFGMLRR